MFGVPPSGGRVNAELQTKVAIIRVQLRLNLPLTRAMLAAIYEAQ